MSNNKIDLIKLYKENPIHETNALIVLNEYLKKIAGENIDINTDILTFAKHFKYEERFNEEYNKRKSIAPEWKIALEKWIEDIDFSINNYNGDLFTTRVYIYNDIISGINNPIHNYSHSIVKSIYSSLDSHLFPIDSDVKYTITDDFTDYIVEGVIYAFQFENLYRELKELKNVTEISIRSQVSEKSVEANILDFEPIKWHKDSVLLAYLFNELQRKGFTKDNTIWKKLSLFFIDKEGKPFKNTTFSNLITSYSKNKTKHNKVSVPTEYKEISDIIEVLSSVIKKTE
jgi:hypothetical protein